MLQNNQCKEQSSFVSVPPRMIHALTTVISTANVGISTAWIILHYSDAASEYKTEYFTVINTPPPKKKTSVFYWSGQHVKRLPSAQ
jgi:hypothetical protein